MTENLFTPRCIRTVSGIYVNVFEPTSDMISIEDIAHALSNQCRFGGHLPQFYSVAQHSIRCCHLSYGDNKLAALLHDASEAYILDIPTPIKKELPNYKTAEDKLMHLIAEKYGFQYPLSEEVKLTDQLMLKIEWDYLMLGKEKYNLSGKRIPFKCLTPSEAKDEFLEMFKKLTN